MCKISIIISIKGYENNLRKTINSIKNQTLNQNELIIVSHNEVHPKNLKTKIYPSIDDAMNNANGEYVLLINEPIFFEKNSCKILYKQMKKNELDLSYIPIVDENFNQNNQTIHNQIRDPFNFAQIFKKDNLSIIKNTNEIFYKINKNSKKISFIDEQILYRKQINVDNLEKYTREFLKMFPNKTNYLFQILLDYLINYPYDLKLTFYNFIKTYFKNYDLNNKNQEIYKLILENNLIDFLTEYCLNNIQYEVYNNTTSNNKYKISIIIPIFNNEKLIHRTLMSIENQSFGIENIEVLMINDASTDNTKKIINEYANKYPNFKAIHIKNGSGSSGTPRNLGLKLSSSKYLLFLDHDDFLEINALEKLYNKIKKYNCDFVYGTYILMNSEESIKFVYPNAQHGFFKNIDDNNTSITTPPSIWTKLFKKEFLEKNNILFPTVLGEDAIFMAKSLKHANGVYYLWDEVICYYNLNENSYSTNLSYKYFLEGFASEEYLFNLFNKWNQIKYYKIRGQGILDFYINRILYSNLTDDELNSIFPEFKKFCNRLYELNIKPKVEKNNIAFNYAIKNDVKGFLKFKNYKPSKIKVFSNKLLNKINKHSFW